MRKDLDVPISYAGIISMIISGGTIISSLLSDRLTRKTGTGKIIFFSVFATAIALLGFSLSNNFILLCIFAIPYGLGAGAVDAVLNNYVALNYSSRHMNWLHCFWGVGATISPYIMGYFLVNNYSWQAGYRTISIIQFVLCMVLLLSMPLWKTVNHSSSDTSVESQAKSFREVVNIKGVKLILIAFFGYCALETTAGLWASSYLVISKSVNSEVAAKFACLLYLGVTFGRFVTGLIANKAGDKNLIRAGLLVILLGIVLVCLPISGAKTSFIGLIIIGLGCAPIYPSIIHSTPYNFGKNNSQAIIGIQMASAYIGSTFMPPVFGLIAQYINISLYPYFLLFFVVLVIVLSERLNKTIQQNHRSK